MKKVALILMIFFAFTSADCLAEYIEGSELKIICDKYNTDDLYNHGVCLGFVVSAYDTYRFSLSSNNLTQKICVPGGVTVGQMVLKVNNYLVNNPDKIRNSGSALVLLALYKAYPCQ